jgi:hypothetical protein
VTALWVCVHPISREKADQLLARRAGIVSHREAMIQIHELHTRLPKHCTKRMHLRSGVLGGRKSGCQALKVRHSCTTVEPGLMAALTQESRLYTKVWPMLSIFDSNKQKTPLEISAVFDRWGAVL